MKTIGDFELVDHGIKHSQYFQGCGAASFRHVATGIGNNPSDAIDDCLEQMAMDGFETEDMDDRIIAQEGWKVMPLTPSIDITDDRREKEACEMWYHVSIRWNEA